MGRLRKERRHNNDVTPETDKIKRPFELHQIEPITKRQIQTFDEYKKGQNLQLIGSAGTGKTFVSLYLALEQILNTRSPYKKIILVRSVVPTREMGFLPGSMKEKIKIYESPYHGICSELFHRDDAYEILKQKNLLEFTSTSFVRGMTFKNAIVIVDEFSNCNYHELDSIITRIGTNSKIIFSGDIKQSDLTNDYDKRGILKFISILQKMKSFSTLEFMPEDIVRSGLVKEYLLTKESMS